MFYKSTKIVVIGSNVTRKAGPRIGSLGYIRNISLDSTTKIDNGVLLIFKATIYFYRYGYEKRERLEKQDVNMIVPIVKEDGSKNILRKAMAFIETKKAEKKKTYLLLSPVIEHTAVFESAHSFCAKVCSMLLQPKLQNVLKSIISGADFAGGMYNIVKLCNIINLEVFQFIVKLHEFTEKGSFNMHKIKESILNTFFKKLPNFDNLIMLINAIDLLEYRQRDPELYEKQPEVKKKSNNPWEDSITALKYKKKQQHATRYSYVQSCQKITSNLFKLNELFKLLNEQGVDNSAKISIIKFREDLIKASSKLQKG
ncbi:hypothetical protein JZU46_04605 [bacterium]|nr:hypothetical protein [bacterium]